MDHGLWRYPLHGRPPFPNAATCTLSRPPPSQLPAPAGVPSPTGAGGPPRPGPRQLLARSAALGAAFHRWADVAREQPGAAATWATRADMPCGAGRGPPAAGPVSSSAINRVRPSFVPSATPSPMRAVAPQHAPPCTPTSRLPAHTCPPTLIPCRRHARGDAY